MIFATKKIFSIYLNLNVKDSIILILVNQNNIDILDYVNRDYLLNDFHDSMGNIE